MHHIHLPPPKILEHQCRVLAALDAILDQSGDYRRYFYEPFPGNKGGMASMGMGDGSNYIIVFCKDGIFGRGYRVNSPVAQEISVYPEIHDQAIDYVPPPFRFLMEHSEATFCFWYEHDTHAWKFLDIGQGDSGIADMFHVFRELPFTYSEWASDHYQFDVPLALITPIFDGAPVTKQLVESLTVNIMWENIFEELDEFGIPHDPL